ncbi:Scr1 family TA system antitoxin-like transcriptional regulator [Nocardiopsis alborubida]|nr:Scr1 family TA system antitoxin-like transcriptional regulator [Nocardiopsis alborubida]
MTIALSQKPTSPQRLILDRERCGPTRAFSPALLPGAVQTRDYARAVITTCAHDTDPVTVRRALEVRMQRHEELLHGAGHHRTYVITELALVCGLVEETVMEAQLAHLRRVAGLGHVDLRLLPADTAEPWTLGFVLRDGQVSLEGPSGLIALAPAAAPFYEAHFEQLVAASQTLTPHSF